MEPILKIVYKDCKKLYEWPGKLDSKDVNVLAVECSQYTEMLERNVLAPYTFKNEKRTFLFSMQYARIEPLLQHLSQLQRASSLQPYEQNDMVSADELTARGDDVPIEFAFTDCDDCLFTTQAIQIRPVMAERHLRANYRRKYCR